MHGFSFSFPLDLEIGFRVEEGIVIPREDFEQAAGMDLFAGVFEIFLMIGHEKKLTAGNQSGFDGS